MVLVGMHAMGGTKNSLLPHSLWEVNEGEMYLSEGSMAAAIAGHHGVPTIFASGDDKIIAELKEKIPVIETATVKQALSVYQARSVIPQRACEMIYEGVKKAISRTGEIKPFVVPGPLKLNLYDSATHQPPLKKLRETPLEADNIDEAFMTYEREMTWTSFDTEDPDGFKFPIE
jgi:D-aminopeptidase